MKTARNNDLGRRRRLQASVAFAQAVGELASRCTTPNHGANARRKSADTDLPFTECRRRGTAVRKEEECQHNHSRKNDKDVRHRQTQRETDKHRLAWTGVNRLKKARKLTRKQILKQTLKQTLKQSLRQALKQTQTLKQTETWRQKPGDRET